MFQQKQSNKLKLTSTYQQELIDRQTRLFAKRDIKYLFVDQGFTKPYDMSALPRTLGLKPAYEELYTAVRSRLVAYNSLQSRLQEQEKLQFRPKGQPYANRTHGESGRSSQSVSMFLESVTPYYKSHLDLAYQKLILVQGQRDPEKQAKLLQSIKNQQPEAVGGQHRLQSHQKQALRFYKEGLKHNSIDQASPTDQNLIQGSKQPNLNSSFRNFYVRADFANINHCERNRRDFQKLIDVASRTKIKKQKQHLYSKQYKSVLAACRLMNQAKSEQQEQTIEGGNEVLKDQSFTGKSQSKNSLHKLESTNAFKSCDINENEVTERTLRRQRLYCLNNRLADSSLSNKKYATSFSLNNSQILQPNSSKGDESPLTKNWVLNTRCALLFPEVHQVVSQFCTSNPEYQQSYQHSNNTTTITTLPLTAATKAATTHTSLHPSPRACTPNSKHYSRHPLSTTFSCSGLNIRAKARRNITIQLKQRIQRLQKLRTIDSKTQSMVVKQKPASHKN